MVDWSLIPKDDSAWHLLVLAGLIGIVLLAGVAAVAVNDPAGDVDAEAAGRCAEQIGRELGFQTGPAAVRQPDLDDSVDGSAAWLASAPVNGFMLEVTVAPDGEVVAARGIGPGGDDPFDREQRLRALAFRCRP